MADASQTIFDASSKVVDLNELKHVDFNLSAETGPAIISEFLGDVIRQIDQGKKIVRVNIPFLRDENPSLNEYDLYLYPIPEDLAETVVPPLSLSHAINILDEILEWAGRNFASNPQVARTQTELGTSILRLQATITESWLSDKPQLDLFKKQLDALFKLMSEIQVEKVDKENTLEQVALLIVSSSDEEVLALWSKPIWKNFSLSQIFSEADKLETGRAIISSLGNIPFHQIRIIANEYLLRAREVIDREPNSANLQSIDTSVRLLRSNSLFFDISQPEATKNEAERVLLGTYIATISEVVTALQGESAEAEKSEDLLDTVLVNEVEEETDQAEDNGGSDRDLADSTPEPPSFPPPVGVPGAQTTAGVPPVGTFTPFVLPPNATLYEKSTYRYEAISVHAGFLLNHVSSNLFGLYPDLPVELQRLPPALQYQLRQDIVRYLNELSPSELATLTKYGRFALGEDLFKRLILRNPTLFVTIEQYVQATSVARGIKLTTVDPLHLEDRSKAFQHEKFIRDLPVKTDTLDSPEFENKTSQLVQSTTNDVYNQSLYQSDESFKSGLVALGIDPIKAISIRNLVLSYIQTTGLDPAYLLNSRNAIELEMMFDGVKLSEAQLNGFITLVGAYWQYQLHKFQTITRRTIVPDPLLVELTAHPLELGDINQIAQIAEEAAKSSISEESYTRLNILASLTSSADLEVNSPQRRIIADALKEFYGNNPDLIDQALRNIQAIQKAERQALAIEAAQHLSHRQIATFHAQYQAQTATQPQAETQPKAKSPYREALATALPVGLVAFNQMSLADREALMLTLFADLDPSQDVPQEMYQNLLSFTNPEWATGRMGDLSELEGDTTTTIGGEVVPTVQPGFIGQIKRGVSRLRTIGSTATQLAKMSAASTSPTASAASRVIGKGAKALLGDEVGGKVEKAAVTIGSASAFISTITTFVTSVATMAIGAIGAIGSFIFTGGFALPAIVGAISAGSAGLGLAYDSFIKPIFAGTTPPPVPPGTQFGPGGIKPISTTTPGGVAVATPTTSASYLATATTVGVGATAASAMLLTMTTQGAFVKTLPTLGDEDISPYVVIEKVATQGVKFDTPTDITYTIRIRARDGYQIQLTQAPTDEFSVTFAQREGENPGRAATDQVPASPEYEAFKTALTTFHTNTPLITTEPVTVGSYTIPFSSNAGGVDYTDANIRNTFTINFTVLDVNGQPVTELTGPTFASSGEVICFGECPQSKGGCWPTSGIVKQMPYGTFSHSKSDGLDIAANEGTPIYSPFEGEACVGHLGGGEIYGNHVIVEVPNSQYMSESGGAQSGTMYLVFGHMHSIDDSITTSSNSCRQVTPGTQIGVVGTTGKSTGPHLHYEARWSASGGGLNTGRMMTPSLLTQLFPEPVKVNDPVRSCYDL